MPYTKILPDVKIPTNTPRKKRFFLQKLAYFLLLFEDIRNKLTCLESSSLGRICTCLSNVKQPPSTFSPIFLHISSNLLKW